MSEAYMSEACMSEASMSEASMSEDARHRVLETHYIQLSMLSWHLVVLMSFVRSKLFGTTL